MSIMQLLLLLNLRYELLPSGKLTTPGSDSVGPSMLIYRGSDLLFVGLENEARRWLSKELSKGCSMGLYELPVQGVQQRENIWRRTGRGRKPSWIIKYLEEGWELDRFEVGTTWTISGLKKLYYLTEMKNK